MEKFVHQTLPSRVVFGVDLLSVVRPEVERLGARRLVIATTPQQATIAREVAGVLDDLDVRIFAQAAMHTPVDVTERALTFVRESRSDAVMSIGGGSAIGLGKAIALRTDLPQIAVPTTYAGSEATPIIGETIDGEKVTQRSGKVLPEVIVYDVALTLTLPVGLSVTSGFNAIAHAAEALYAQDRTPLIELLATDGIRSIGRSLPKIVAKPGDVTSRSQALYGAWACGVCLGSAEMGLHHKLCHALGGLFDLPHADLHSVLLPYSLAYNAPAAPSAMQAIAGALGVDDAPRGLWRLLRSLGAPRSLQEIGMPASGLDRAAEAALSRRYPNPRPLEQDPIRALLERAYRGDEPN